MNRLSAFARQCFKSCLVLPLVLCSSQVALFAQAGGELLPLAKSRYLVNVVVHAPLNSDMHKTIQSYVNNLRQDDWNLNYFYLDPKSPLYLREISIFKNRFGEPAWAIILPDGRLLATSADIPSYEVFERILQSTEMNKPIPRLRQFLRQNPNNLDARAELIRLLRASAYRRTKQELGITQSSMWEAKDEKRYSILPPAGFVLPDVTPFKELQLEPEKDLLIWARYAQELSEVFQNGTWHKMGLGMDANSTLPLEVCSQIMKVTFIRIKPRIEEEIANLPGSENLWKLWLHVQACIDSENYKFNFFDGIEPPPEVAGISWPPEGAIVPLVKHFYEQKNWVMVLRLTSKYYEEEVNGIKSDNNLTQIVPEYKVARYIDWDGKFKPMLEALIATGQRDEADAFINLIYTTENGRTFVGRAIQSARSLGETNLAGKWQLLIGGLS